MALSSLNFITISSSLSNRWETHSQLSNDEIQSSKSRSLFFCQFEIDPQVSLTIGFLFVLKFTENPTFTSKLKFNVMNEFKIN